MCVFFCHFFCLDEDRQPRVDARPGLGRAAVGTARPRRWRRAATLHSTLARCVRRIRETHMLLHHGVVRSARGAKLGRSGLGIYGGRGRTAAEEQRARRAAP